MALPPRVAVLPLADVCRSAALEFLNGSGRSWEKRELARWLAGPYRTLTSFAQRQQRESERMISLLTRAAAVRPARTAPRASEVPVARVVELVARARREVRATLEGLRDPDLGVGFVFDVLVSGHVHRCVDRDGETGWAPVDLPRLRLADRVLSLIAVDYMLRAEDYEQKLATCATCGVISFGDREKGCRGCREPVTKSGAPGAPSVRAGAA